MPFAVTQDREAALGCGRSADDMHDDIDAVEAIAYGVGHGRAAFGRGNVGRHEQIGSCSFFRLHASSDKYSCTSLAQPRRDGLAYPLGAAGDECPAPVEFQIATH